MFKLPVPKRLANSLRETERKIELLTGKGGYKVIYLLADLLTYKVVGIESAVNKVNVPSLPTALLLLLHLRVVKIVHKFMNTPHNSLTLFPKFFFFHDFPSYILMNWFCCNKHSLSTILYN